MSRIDLYQKCSLCNATLITIGPAMVDGVKTESGKVYTGEYPAGATCLCTQSSTPGYDAVGLTLGQVDAVRDDRDRLLVLIDDLSRTTNDYDRASVITQEIGGRGSEIQDIRTRRKPSLG